MLLKHAVDEDGHHVLATGSAAEVGGVAVVVLREPDGAVRGLEIHAGRVTGLVFEREPE